MESNSVFVPCHWESKESRFDMSFYWSTSFSSSNFGWNSQPHSSSMFSKEARGTVIVIFWTESPTTFAASPQMLIMSMQKHASNLVIPNCRARMASRYKQKTSELNHLWLLSIVYKQYWSRDTWKTRTGPANLEDATIEMASIFINRSTVNNFQLYVTRFCM